MDDTDNLYAQYKWYIAVSNHSDADGYADIYYVEFRLNQSSTSYAIFRYVEDNDTFKIVVGSDKWDFDTSSSSAIKSGNWINVTWKFKPQWDAVQDSDLEIECYVIDSGSATDQDVMQTNYCDVITDLAVSNFSVNNARGNVGATITLSGKVHYSGYVSRSPPDSEFNCVQIWNSTDDVKGTDNTVVNGEFSVSFTASNDVKDYTDAEEGVYDSYISDRILITNVYSDDSRRDVSSTATIYVHAELEFDGHVVGGGVGDSMSINGLQFNL